MPLVEAMDMEEQLTSGDKDRSSEVEKSNESNSVETSVGSNVNQVAEVDRMSTDSPMFNDPQDQDILASSSSSEDAFKSLEKLENLARLAENAALEDRDVETPQSFVNAEDAIDDVGVTEDVNEETNNMKMDYNSAAIGALTESSRVDILPEKDDSNGT